ncbi:MAG: UPF0149 family protein [Gammaproteobacteria bacterium]|nr:UPF0149 family protein [Gammaproteobacteria bacterium]
MPASPSYRQVEEALAQLGVRPTPAEVHGLICGALCIAQTPAVRPLTLLGERVAGDTISAAVLDALRDASAAALADPQAGLTLLLPDDEVPLAQRTRALAAWCDGFLFGVAGRSELELERCSEEVREVVGDFVEFTRAALREGDDAEVEEGAYAELVEYIRVGAQLMFMELRGRPPDHAAPTLH